MKKIIYLSLILLSTQSFAQDHKWYVGGGINANIASTNQPNSPIWQARYTLTPEIGTYITPNIQLGGNLAFGENVTRSNGGTSRSPNLGLGVYGRYLFGENAFHPFVGAGVKYNMNSGSWSSFSNNASYSSILINAGVLYNVNPRWTCFASLGTFGYTSSRINVENGPDVISRNLGLNLNSIGENLTIGLYYNFGRAL